MILVVDDFADGRDVLCRLLVASGYPCRSSSNGREAIVVIRSHPPEQPLLVVMDAMMPDLTGIEVLQQIRADAKISQTTVLMFSAGFDTAQRDAAITLGAAAWILKGAPGGFEEICGWYERIGGVRSVRGVHTSDFNLKNRE